MKQEIVVEREHEVVSAFVFNGEENVGGGVVYVDNRSDVLPFLIAHAESCQCFVGRKHIVALIIGLGQMFFRIVDAVSYESA